MFTENICNFIINVEYSSSFLILNELILSFPLRRKSKADFCLEVIRITLTLDDEIRYW